MSRVLLCLMLVTVLMTAAAHAQDTGQPLKIPPLPPQDDSPHFHIKNEAGDWPLETPLQVIRRELAEDARGSHRVVPGVGTTPPLVAVDVLPAIMGAIKAVRDAHYAHEVADAQQRVAQDLADFCAMNDCSEQARLPEGVLVTQPQQP